MGPKEWRRGGPIAYDNGALRAYYRDQGICEDAEELCRMFDVYQTELPAAFRLTASFEMPILTKKFYDEADLEGDKPATVGWCPVAYAMQHLDRRELRKSEKWRAFKARLVADFERGALQRQELVSMIPVSCMLNFCQLNADGPVLTNIRVLDMCAAPGSKTSQALDYITRQCTGNRGFPQIPPQCALIGNELDISRARLLSHQIQKVENPFYATICSEASNLPKAQTPNTLYTNVICDVPCSGDGTLRKNINIWNTWNPSSGMALHSRQVKILLKGLELLSPGGVLVYSTCSMNPLENEAVVAAGLQHNPDCHLVPITDCLPELSSECYKSGLTRWKVPAVLSFRPYMPVRRTEKENDAVHEGEESQKDVAPMVNPSDTDSESKKQRLEEPRYFKNIEEAKAEQQRPVVHETMFEEHYDERIRSELVKTARFAPHLLNSGGFYVAVIRRPEDAPLPSLKNHKKVNESLYQYGQDTVRVEPLRSNVCGELRQFYGLGTFDYAQPVDKKGLVLRSERLASVATCPLPTQPYQMEDWSNLLYQKTESEKKILLGTPQLYELYQNSAALNFISFGACVMEQLDRKFITSCNCEYRITGAGAVWLGGYMSRRRVELPTDLMARLLEEDGLSKVDLLKEEAVGRINLDGCRRPAPDGAMLLETGGAIVTCADTEKDPLIVAALITGAGHLQPMIRRASRLTLANILSH